MAVISLVISAAALVLAIWSVRSARQARRAAEALLEETEARTRAMRFPVISKNH